MYMILILLVSILMYSDVHMVDAHITDYKVCQRGEIGYWGYIKVKDQKVGFLFLSDKFDDFTKDDIRCIVPYASKIVVLEGSKDS